jgi:hypothetical protein
MLLGRYLTHMDMVENVTEYSEMLQLRNWLLLPLTNNDNVTFKTAVTVRFHRRVHGIKHTYLAPCIHGLFITKTQFRLSTTFNI